MMKFWGEVTHGCRVLGAGVAFATFGIGGILLSLSLFPLIRLTTFSKESARRRTQRAMHYVFRLFVAQMRLFDLVSYEVHHGERLTQPGRLIVANHPSLIDVVLLIALLPEADCIVKNGLLRNPFLRWPVVWADYIPNNDSAEALIENAAAKLRAGRTLIIFPEGTRSVPGQPLTMQRGAARIALAARAEILPVTIDCKPLMLSKGVPWYGIPRRPGHWRLQVGTALRPADYIADGVSEAVAARQLTQHFVEYFTRSLAQPAAAALDAAVEEREQLIPLN